jgi:hypothetical protein
MTTLKVTDGTATLFLTVSAEYTSEEIEPILCTETVTVPRDHPLIRALVDDGGWIRRDSRDDPEVQDLLYRLRETLALFFGPLDD